MAVGTTTALIGSAVLDAGTSYLSSQSQSNAIKDANRAAQQTGDAQIALYRDIYNQQRADFEPFRQIDLQRQGAVNEILGLPSPATGSGSGGGGGQSSGAAQSGPDWQAYVDRYPAVATEAARLRGQGSFGASMPRSYDFNGNGRLEDTEYAAHHYDKFGRNEGRELTMLGQASTVGPGSMSYGPYNVQGQTGSNPVMNPIAPSAGQPVNNGAASSQNAMSALVDPNAPGATNFNNSLFASAAQAGLNRDMDRIDASLGDAVFSGARQTASANAAADRSQNALAQYMQTLGAPVSSSSTNAMANAAGQYGASAANAMGNQANAAMQSAYARAGNNASMYNALGSLGGAALGLFG